MAKFTVKFISLYIFSNLIHWILISRWYDLLLKGLIRILKLFEEMFITTSIAVAILLILPIVTIHIFEKFKGKLIWWIWNFRIQILSLLYLYAKTNGSKV